MHFISDNVLHCRNTTIKRSSRDSFWPNTRSTPTGINYPRIGISYVSLCGLIKEITLVAWPVYREIIIHPRQVYIKKSFPNPLIINLHLHGLTRINRRRTFI